AQSHEPTTRPRTAQYARRDAQRDLSADPQRSTLTPANAPDAPRATPQRCARSLPANHRAQDAAHLRVHRASKHLDDDAPARESTPSSVYRPQRTLTHPRSKYPRRTKAIPSQNHRSAPRCADNNADAHARINTITRSSDPKIDENDGQPVGFVREDA